MWSMRRCGIGVVLLVAAGLTACGATAGTGGGPSRSTTAVTVASTTAPPTSTPTTRASTAIAVPAPSSVAASSSIGPSPTAGPSSSPKLPPVPSAPAPSRTSLFGSTVPKPGVQLTLTGTVEAGVEPSCLLLTDEKTGRRVNITGGDKAVVTVGARITVVGHIRTDLRSYCQQGAIFQVVAATVP